MFDTFFYNPIYNLVIFLFDTVSSDAGVVIILTTIIIKFFLFPFYTKQINNQIATKHAKPEIDKLAKKYKGKTLTKEQNQEKVKETFAIYKKYNIKPFSSLFLIILQGFIIFALYWIFYAGGLPKVIEKDLYSFIKVPEFINMTFFGFFDLTKTSILLAFVAAATQFLHLSISMPDVKLSDLKKKKGDIKEDMMNSFQVNIKYGLPILILVILLTVLNAAVALYWITSNLFMAAQEFFVRGKKEQLKNMDKKNGEKNKKNKKEKDLLK